MLVVRLKNQVTFQSSQVQKQKNMEKKGISSPFHHRPRWSMALLIQTPQLSVSDVPFRSFRLSFVEDLWAGRPELKLSKQFLFPQIQHLEDCENLWLATSGRNKKKTAGSLLRVLLGMMNISKCLWSTLVIQKVHLQGLGTTSQLAWLVRRSTYITLCGHLPVFSPCLLKDHPWSQKVASTVEDVSWLNRHFVIHCTLNHSQIKNRRIHVDVVSFPLLTVRHVW